MSFPTGHELERRQVGLEWPRCLGHRNRRSRLIGPDQVSPVSQSRLISFSQTLTSSPQGTAYEQGRSQRVSRYDTQVLPPSSFSCPHHRQFLGSCPEMLSRRTCRESRHTLNRAKARVMPHEFAALCRSKRRLVAAARRIPNAFRAHLQDDGLHLQHVREPDLVY